MEVLTQLSGGLVAAVAVFVVGYLGKERYDAKFASADREFAAIRTTIAEMRDDMRQMRGEMAAMRSDLMQVALAVGARTRPDAS